MRIPRNLDLWENSGGLVIDWDNPDAEDPFGKYRFRLWKARRADGQPMAVLMWPNHPTRHPFAGGPEGEHWQAAKRQADKFLKKHRF
jgi:hypothetical protein